MSLNSFSFRNFVLLIICYFIPLFVFSQGEQEYMHSKLQPIRDYVKELDQRHVWTRVDTVETRESTEGGHVEFMYSNDTLTSIKEKIFGEMFRKFNDYYLKDDSLVFVLETEWKYNRPIYWDETKAKEIGDTAAFDFEKSEVTIVESFFENQQMIRQINNMDCGSPMAKDYLQDAGQQFITQLKYFRKLKNTP